MCHSSCGKSGFLFFSSILRIYKIKDILPGDCVRKVLIDRAWDMRLIGKVAEPGALNGLHAKGSGAIEFVRATVAYVEAFLGCDVQGLYGTAVDFRGWFEKALFVGNHCGIKKGIERG